MDGVLFAQKDVKVQVRNHQPTGQIELCVGVLCCRDNQILLIRRAQDPQKGQWSIPGGRVMFGETLIEAAKRELFEETGVEAEIDEMIGHFEFIAEDYHYVVFDYYARWSAHEPVAGDDADDAQFMTATDALDCVASEDLRRLIVRAFGL
jgi:8-oxo-dGTP diphosphatase